MAKNRSYRVEAQHLFKEDHFNLTSGGGHSIRNVDSIIDNQKEVSSSEFNNFYIYSNWRLPRDIITTLGFSYNFYKSIRASKQTNKFDPKIGLQWNILENLRLRLAWFETVKADLIGQQTIEPTQVAGFNQFFDDPNGTKSRRKGIGLDGNLTNKIFGGAEASVRDLNIPIFGRQTTIQKQKEQVYRAYLYGLLSPHWSFTSEFQFEKFSRNLDLSTNDIAPNFINTLSIPIKVNYFNPNGLFASLSGTFVNQNIKRLSKNHPAFPILRAPKELKIQGKSNFFLLDAVVGYRMPSRNGLFSLEAKNILDENFNYRNQQFNVSEPLAPRYSPSRTFFVRLTLNF